MSRVFIHQYINILRREHVKYSTTIVKSTIQFLAVLFNDVLTIKLVANEHRHFNCIISDIFAIGLTDIILFVQCHKLSHHGL
jgi:hypothetical protein